MCVSVVCVCVIYMGHLTYVLGHMTYVLGHESVCQFTHINSVIFRGTVKYLCSFMPLDQPTKHKLQLFMYK